MFDKLLFGEVNPVANDATDISNQNKKNDDD